jgi:hypothetical protein
MGHGCNAIMLQLYVTSWLKGQHAVWEKTGRSPIKSLIGGPVSRGAHTPTAVSSDVPVLLWRKQCLLTEACAMGGVFPPPAVSAGNKALGGDWCYDAVYLLATVYHNTHMY